MNEKCCGIWEKINIDKIKGESSQTCDLKKFMRCVISWEDLGKKKYQNDKGEIEGPDTQNSSNVKIADVYFPSLLAFGHEQFCDQEPRKAEEQIHADPAVFVQCCPDLAG